MKSQYDNLVSLGASRTVAKVIEVLSDNKEHSLRDIERKADLRQPEVSLAVAEIGSFLASEYRHSEGGGKGRPTKYVKMSRDRYEMYIDVRVSMFATDFENAKLARNELMRK